MADTLLSGWTLAPLPATVLLMVAVTYVMATARVDRTQPFQLWPRWNTVFFLAGIAALWVAVMGPPGSFDDVFFYAHMTQHVLLTMVAAPLLVLGNPVLLSLRAAPRAFRRRWLVPLYRSRAVELITHPVVGWLAFVGVMVISHIPAVYDYALSHPLVHDFVEHPLYVASALLYFYPVLSATAGRRTIHPAIQVLSIFTMMIPTALLGFFIYASPHLAYPFYAHAVRPFGPAPLQDQELSGALMWTSAMILGALWLCLAGQRWLEAEERRSHRVDRAVARSLGTGRKPPRQGMWT